MFWIVSVLYGQNISCFPRLFSHQNWYSFASPWNPDCIAPMVWAFLSTTVQLHATHRKVEGGERDTQLVHVNEANSCFARGYCVLQAAQGERCLSSPPPPSPFLSYSPPPLPRLNLCDFQRPRPKARMASFRGSRVLQLNSDSFCDYVRIWTEVIGHLWAELGFWFFPGKRWQIFAAANIWTGCEYFGRSCRYNSQYSTAETPPI